MPIIIPPENIKVYRNSNVTIRCGYQWFRALPVTWIINGTSFTQQEIVDSPLYQLNNPTTPRKGSLTVFSINGTTTFQCIVHSTPSITSPRATVTLFGRYIHIEYYVVILLYICRYKYDMYIKFHSLNHVLKCLVSYLLFLQLL